MSKNESYTGIDYFRLICALLIVAIHTSPLLSFSVTGDFILTRGIARVAVPFFFMTSGFFIVSRYTYDAEKLRKFVKKTAIIYGIAILLYIPINIYNGYFSMDNLMPNLIQDIMFDGTLYHLWYLPASILGATIAWYTVKGLGYPNALAITGILYIIGLFGDSYYGIAEKVSGLNGFYNLIFQISDYTRNGIFFAPVFFVLGGFIADRRQPISFCKNVWGFVISLPLMLGEAMVLHHFTLQRHDSMYVFLIPCMFFLFSGILHFRGKRIFWLRTSALLIYIVHPMVIAGIHMLGKIENSLVHYFTVCLISVIFGVTAAILRERYRPGQKKCSRNTDRAWIKINLEHLEHNVEVLQKAMPAGCEFMAVVKAEAYGHGAFEISTHLDKIGVRAFAVATIEEGISLRKYGVQGEILILGYTDVHRASELKKYNLIQTLIGFEYAKALNRQGVSIKAHIKIDTGMHRLGIESGDMLYVKRIFAMKNIKVCGIYTHLCCSDSLLPDDVAFTQGQITAFYHLIDELKASGITIPKLHIQSSYGLLNYPGVKCDYVRVGIALYGVLSTPERNTGRTLDLRPVLSLKTKVVLIRSVKKGESIGYGRSFITERDSKIAILPVGYGDGFPRSLSGGKGSVMIHQQKLPVIGRICMDQIAVDITDAENISVGDTATLICSDEASALSASVVADSAGSISNELLSRMGARLPRGTC